MVAVSKLLQPTFLTYYINERAVIDQCTRNYSFSSRMAEMDTELPKRKHVRQPPAVPFLWEQKPGIPKKDWKPEDSSVIPIVVTPPVKLIASIPFDWEEKPGTPLPSFSQPAVLPNPPEKLLALPPPPPMYSQGYYGIFNNDETSDGDRDKPNGSFDFDTDDSFSSAPSLLANCLVPSVAISSAVPVQRSLSSDTTSDELEIPSSPASEAESSTSSYETGTSSLVGASFLECLFPLLPPKTSFLEKARYTERDTVIDTPEVKNQDFDCESNSTVVIRRPTTLGELIMMSRRRSNQRKAVQMRKQNLSMEFEKRPFGCCAFGSSIKMFEGLQRKKQQLILKFLQE